MKELFAERQPVFMRAATPLFAALLLLAVAAFPGANTGMAATDIFSDDFGGATLNPAWQILSGQGSYTVGGGQLRYYHVGPVASTTGWYNPSLTLALPFTGTSWKVEIKATYSLSWSPSGNYTGPATPTSYSTGAQVPQVVVKFDPGTVGNNYAGTDYTLIRRAIDAWYGANVLTAHYGATSSSNLLNPANAGIQNNIADGTYWFQIIRSDGILTIKYSYDGSNYATAFSAPLLNPSSTYNELLLGGMTYQTAGSFTDYDYVSISSLEPVDAIAPVVSNVTVIPNPAPVNGGLTLSADLSDAGGSNLTAANYTVNGVLSDPVAVSGETAHISTALAPFGSTGVYNICVRAEDGAGNVSSDGCLLLPVYDPAGGFVTGGGWIMSPPGAYTPDGNLSGKATFGFVSKYQKGANVPTGDTQFQFRAANMNFKSTVYEWLVIAGARAQYKGSGTINGAGDYRFLLTAIDGDVAGGGGIDRFRVRIWGENGIVYDNQMGTPDNGDPATALGGGSIVIHKQ